MAILSLNCLKSNTFNGILSRSRLWTTSTLLLAFLFAALYLSNSLHSTSSTGLIKPLYGKPRIALQSNQDAGHTPPLPPLQNQTKLLIPLTSPSKPFCQSIYTALLHSYTPIILHLQRRRQPSSVTLLSSAAWWNALGWEVRVPKFWERWYKVKTDKTGTVGDYLEEVMKGGEGVVGRDEVVVVADGLDIWYQLPAEEMIRRFLATTKDLVIAAERNCHPPTTKFMCDAYGERLEGKEVQDESGNLIPRKALPQYANTGLLFGTPETLSPLYLSMLTSQTSNLFNMPDDQGLAHVELYRYPTGKTDEALGGVKIGLDHASELGFNLAHSEEDVRVVEMTEDDEARLANGFTRNVTSTPVGREKAATYIKNRQTGQTPAAVHYSSKELKSQFSHDWAQQWFSAGGLIGDGEREIDLEAIHEKVRAGSMRSVEEERWRSWEDVCGEFELF